MLGPLNAQPKVRKVTERRERTKLGALEKPQEIKEVNTEEKQETDRLMEEMFEVLQEHSPVPWLELIMNVESFSQTVENIFTLSFLVRLKKHTAKCSVWRAIAILSDDLMSAHCLWSQCMCHAAALRHLNLAHQAYKRGHLSIVSHSDSGLHTLGAVNRPIMLRSTSGTVCTACPAQVVHGVTCFVEGEYPKVTKQSREECWCTWSNLWRAKQAQHK